MKIRSQDRENLINFDFYDYRIRADKHIIAFSGTREILLGTYEDKNCCREIMDKMIKSHENKKSIYNMPQIHTRRGVLS